MEKQKWYQKTWILVLLGIFLPIICIIVIWVTRKDMSQRKKIVLSVIMGIWFLIALGINNSTGSKTEDNSSEASVTETGQEETGQPSVSETVEEPATEAAPPRDIAESTETTDKKQEEISEETIQDESAEKAVDANGWNENDYAMFVTATKTMMDDYLTGYKVPWGFSDWTFAKFDDKDAIMVSTKAELRDTSVKQDVYCVFTIVDNDGDGEFDAFKRHYLEVGGTVFESDGYIDEFLSNLQDIAGALD